MQREIRAAFAWGKRAVIVRRYPAPPTPHPSPFCVVQCFRDSIPLAVRFFSFTTDGYGIFNVRTNLAVRAEHTKGGGGGGPGTNNKSALELILRDKKTNCPSPYPTMQGIEPI